MLRISQSSEEFNSDDESCYSMDELVQLAGISAKQVQALVATSSAQDMSSNNIDFEGSNINTGAKEIRLNNQMDNIHLSSDGGNVEVVNEVTIESTPDESNGKPQSANCSSVSEALSQMVGLNSGSVFHGDLLEARKRKKRAKKSQHKRHINHTKRMTGGEYIGFERVKTTTTTTKQVQNIVRPAKIIGPTCKSPVCQKSKLRNCDKFSEDTRLQLFQQFWKMDWGEKRAYVGSLIDVVPKKRSTTTTDSKRDDTFNYWLKLEGVKVRVCRFMFLKTLAISPKQLRGWVRRSHGLEPASTSENRAQQSSVNNGNAKTRILTDFLDSLPKVPSHYCRSSSTKLYLEPIISSKNHLYRLYRNHCLDLGFQPYSRWKVDRTFEDLNLSLFLPKKDLCDTCCGFDVGNIPEDVYKAHIENKTKAREEKIRDKQLASQSKCHGRRISQVVTNVEC